MMRVRSLYGNWEGSDGAVAAFERRDVIEVRTVTNEGRSRFGRGPSRHGRPHGRVSAHYCWLLICALGTWAACASPQVAPPAEFGSRPEQEVPEERRAVSRLSVLNEEVQYSIGDPSDDEQLYLELLNYARANPSGEAQFLANIQDPDIQGAYHFFNVDLSQFIADTSQYPVAPPLAFEPRLIQAARSHSQWMLDHGQQAHTETDPTASTQDRITATGYPWQSYGENIYAYAESPLQGHAGFEVDWGFGPGGMQNPAGHRVNNHRIVFREVGVGVVLGRGLSNTGPSSVTVDFAARVNPLPLMTGVAYFDLNSNGRYDLGEGISGIRVNAQGSGYYAITSSSGGYAVPGLEGSNSLVFSGKGINTSTFTPLISDGNNVKVDLRLPYTGPVLQGPTQSPTNKPIFYAFNPIPGVTQYRGRVASISSLTPGFDGSQGLSGIITNLTGTMFPLVYRTTKNYAYHLTHGETYSEETMELNIQLRPKANASLSFLSRLGYASTNELARVEASTDNGATWKSLWSQSGTGDIGENYYTQRTISLADMAGQTVRVRFRYGFNPCTECTWYTQSDNGVGFHFDNVAFAQTDFLVGTSEVDLSEESLFSFTPKVAGVYELSVQPVKAKSTLPYGPPLILTTSPTATSPTITLTGSSWGPTGLLQIQFKVVGTLTGTPSLLRAPTLSSPYVTASATLKTNAPGVFTMELKPEGEAGFLKVSLP